MISFFKFLIISHFDPKKKLNLWPKKITQEKKKQGKKREKKRKGGYTFEVPFMFESTKEVATN